jgi:hypothetical protein
MEVPSHIVCDVCGLPKGATNHWLVAIVRPGYEGILIQPAEASTSPRDPDFKYSDICGQQCAHKQLSRWFDESTGTALNTESEAA